MTLIEMITTVREKIGERVENYWKTSFITESLNRGRRRFCNEEKWDWLFTTQSGIAVTQGASTIELIDEVVVNRHFNLVLTKSGDTNLYIPDRVSPSEGLQLRKMHLDASTPRWWYTTGQITNDYGAGDIAVAQLVRLVPTPEVAYTAEYNFFRRPNKLALDADEDTTIPEDYQDAAVYWAVAECFAKEDNAQHKVDEALGFYSDVLRQARSDRNEPAEDKLIVWGKDHPENGGRRNQWPPRMNLGA